MRGETGEAFLKVHRISAEPALVGEYSVLVAGPSGVCARVGQAMESGGVCAVQVKSELAKRPALCKEACIEPE